MDTIIQEKVNNWLTGNFDTATKDEITRLQKDNEKELEDAFYRNLELTGKKEFGSVV